MIDEQPQSQPPTALPVIALIGRPNVGKSTLFNRLTRSRMALVTDIPGTTRDRREAEVEREPHRFVLVDMGGLEFSDEHVLSREIGEQIELGLADADAVWMVVDAFEGMSPFDVELYRWVSRSRKPVLVLANKAENDQRRTAAAEFYGLGCEMVYPVSALHGVGISEVLEATAAAIPGMRGRGTPEPEPEDRPLRVAFLGRPNVGKSSLVNRVLGEGRMIVSEMAGTTREAVEVPFEMYGQQYVLVDTAGLRRKARTTEYLDKIGALQSLGALHRVDVAVLVLDAGEEVAVQDARIGGYIEEYRRGVVIVLNKWDTLRGGAARAKEVEDGVRHKLRFLDYAAIVRTSALSGEGIEHMFKEIGRAGEQFGRKVQTADLNRMIESAVQRTAPPSLGRSPTRIYYGLQVAQRPPTFRFFTNHIEQMGESYTRYMRNQLRYTFGFRGTPLGVLWQDKREKTTRGRSGAPRTPKTQQRDRPDADPNPHGAEEG